MGNLKIRVNSQAESKEAQDLLVKMGYHARKNWTQRNPIHESIQAWKDGEFTFSLDHDRVPVGFKEITLPELRDMVILKRNNVSDEDPTLDKIKIKVDGSLNRAIDIAKSEGYYNCQFNKIPENAHWLLCNEDGTVDYSMNENILNEYMMLHNDPKSLNDQYAEIEQVRQHRHYFIDVSDVDEIDFYEIALRYNVTDPCIQHILKKCLAVGQRGQKDFHHDLKDIYDTAKRMLDVHGLDS